jgi:hypothetical protein
MNLLYQQGRPNDFTDWPGDMDAATQPQAIEAESHPICMKNAMTTIAAWCLKSAQSDIDRR